MAALISRADKLLEWLAPEGSAPSSSGLRPHHWMALLALLLTAPSLGGGLLLDDHVLALGVGEHRDAVAGLHPSPLSLFTFTTGRPPDNRALMDEAALLPWWSDEHHLNAFLRPLSSLTHVLDFRLFPDAQWLMHLHSMLWLVALVLVVAHVVQRIDGGATLTAGLAVLLFAIDDSHGMPVAWIANRNALVAATLALPALGAHHRWLAHNWAPGRFLGPLCFALGLCAGETAVAVFGYLIAHALVLDHAPIPERAVHLLPYFVILVVWAIVFAQLGLGSAGSGAYHHPLADPLGYAAALAVHLPLLLGSQLGVPVADSWFWGPPSSQLIVLGFACFSMAVALGLAHLLLRRDPIARFWMIGMVLSACAVAASVPGERLLLVPSIGGAALMARLLLALRAALLNTRGKAASSWELPIPRSLAAALLLALAIVHGPASLLGLSFRAAQMQVLGAAIARADAGVPTDASIADKTVLIVNAPFDALVSYLQVARAAAGVPRPAHLQWLSTASSKLEIARMDEQTLRIEPEQGYLWTSSEQHYRADVRALAIGSEVRLSAFTARIASTTPDGRPHAVDFILTEPMHSPALALKQFSGGELVPFLPPAVGQRVVLPAHGFFEALVAQAQLPLTRSAD